MCGISGIAFLNKPHSLEQRLNQMLNSMMHRGPDNSSFKILDNLAMAHTRLSIIDLSDTANQPMTDLSGRFVITFNGEIYNYRDLKEDLIKDGYSFQNDSDTEVLLNGYIARGLDFLKEIRGFFAFAIYDKSSNELLLARDVYGKKPLFYTLQNKEFIFASELKTILMQLRSIPEIDYEGLSHFLWKGYFIDGFTAYSNVHSLKPGMSLRINLDNLQIIEEKRIDSINIFVGNNYAERSISNVEHSLINAVDYRMIADVPISYLLSGGVDSSLISSIASKEEEIDTYYLGYGDEDDIFERLATDVSSMIGSNHTSHKMSEPRFDQALDDMVRLFGEPFADFSALPSNEIYKIISQHTKVAISGDGADEIFGGYKDARLFLLRMFSNSVLSGFDSERLLSKIYEMLNSSNKGIRYFGHAISLILDEGHFSATTYRSGWTFNYRKEIMSEKGLELTDGNSIENTESKKYMASGNNPLERYLNYDLQRLSYDFLVKVDRTSMANSLEVRSPYLDKFMLKEINHANHYSLVDFSETKKELKTLLRKRDLAEVTRIRKKGFTPPLLKWMSSKSGLSELDKMTRNPFINDLFSRNKLVNLFDTNKKLKINQIRLWNLLILSSWHNKTY